MGYKNNGQSGKHVSNQEPVTYSGISIHNVSTLISNLIVDMDKNSKELLG